ncbi:MAG TPA: hypothetical protein VFR73_20715 [Hyphomicrobiaceae bacterium]|nr:hypothetical protein [Hyphomicrobiaceae bacterium]
MVTRKNEAHLSDTWRYEPAAGTGPHGRIRQVAEVSALLAGVAALGIALTAPLAWMLRADGEVVLDREGALEPPGETRIMRTEPVHTGSTRDPGDTLEALEILARERTAKAAAERAAYEAHARLAVAERAVQEARRELEAEQTARQATHARLNEVSEELARERTAKEAAEVAAKDAQSRKRKGWKLLKVERWTW